MAVYVKEFLHLVRRESGIFANTGLEFRNGIRGEEMVDDLCPGFAIGFAYIEIGGRIDPGKHRRDFTIVPRFALSTAEIESQAMERFMDKRLEPILFAEYRNRVQIRVRATVGERRVRVNRVRQFGAGSGQPFFGVTHQQNHAQLISNTSFRFMRESIVQPLFDMIYPALNTGPVGHIVNAEMDIDRGFEYFSAIRYMMSTRLVHLGPDTVGDILVIGGPFEFSVCLF